MKKRKKENDFIDDGRVIANMNIDGMPRSIIKRTAFDEFGKTKEKKESVKLSKQERRSILLGVMTSYILFAVIVFGAFALFILFCINVWFK
ncbi:MAG: hypothetical protein GX379_07480 [Clostridiales bacterium]|jgi:hypothetical protein|nr:hypothetical protein [Clostridiales bacterium]